MERFPEGLARRRAKELAEQSVGKLMRVEGMTWEEAAHQVLTYNIKELDRRSRYKAGPSRQHTDLMRRFEATCMLREVHQRQEAGDGKDAAVGMVAEARGVSKRVIYDRLKALTKR